MVLKQVLKQQGGLLQPVGVTGENISGSGDYLFAKALILFKKVPNICLYLPLEKRSGSSVG